MPRVRTVVVPGRTAQHIILSGDADRPADAETLKQTPLWQSLANLQHPARGQFPAVVELQVREARRVR